MHFGVRFTARLRLLTSFERCLQDDRIPFLLTPGKEPALIRPYLKTIILPVGDIDTPGAIHGDIGRIVELAILDAKIAEIIQEDRLGAGDIIDADKLTDGICNVQVVVACSSIRRAAG